MGSTHGWATGAATPKPNLVPASSACLKDPKVHRPASRSYSIGAASPPTCTTSTCLCLRCSSRPGLRDHRIEPARRAADPEAMHNRMTCACRTPVSPVSFHVAPHNPVTHQGNASWTAITALPRPQPSHAGAILGGPRCRAGQIKSHFAGDHGLHSRR
ncbi:hypothetical protein CCMA1212_009240 [Trichoderma ghanense]|uniref:Uncharacterized protein n=1 Tax=Trichoderma ghanense TaxID=65468 RepID=A0ABY2GT40_9HYPO